MVAWDASLNYDIHVASGIFGFTTGEGIVNEFHGSGTVLDVYKRQMLSDYSLML